MRFGILGPLVVADDEGREIALGGPKQRAVLAILLLHAREVVSSDRLIEDLWGERAPASAAKTIQVYVSHLRKALGDGVLLSSAGGYALQAEPGVIDAERFRELAGEGHDALRAGDARAAAARLRKALDVWRGPALPDFAYEPFAQGELARLEESRLGALEDRIDAELALGEHAALVGELEALIREQPLRERLRGQLMLALYRSGRHPDALGAYREVVATLDEIGLQPGPDLRALEQAILRHDPSLAGPVALGEQLAAEAVPRRPGESATSVPLEHAGGGGAAHGWASPARRKVVTALFCDVVGSTQLGEDLDPEALHGVMNHYWREVRAIIERHGGTVDKFIGDAVMAVFGIPQVREDDALRAVRAAAEIRERLPVLAEEIGVALSFRTAVNTGLVLVGEGENLTIGDAVNVAARLEQAAAPGEILLGEETFGLVRDAVEVEPLEPLALKGKTAPVRAFRLVALDPAAAGVRRRFDAPLVGRRRELGLLQGAWQRTLDESGCHLLTLLGVAGVGKSRLVSELLASVDDDVRVLSGRCLPYGEGITFWPLVEALGPVGDPARGVLDRLAGGSVAVPEELFWEVRRLLESLAAERPVIVHVDDLQWAQPMLFDLLDHVADLSRVAPVLLMCTARPELLEDRPGWGGGKLNATTLLLEPLAAPESRELLDELGDDLDPDARARIVTAADGNPLFLEEMAALSRERGTVEIPSTIQALLAARLERLDPEDRELLDRGAVEGEVFHQGLVCALVSEPLAVDIDRRLAGLVRQQLIRPHPPALEGETAFRFRHLLIRDAAYDGLPKATRTDLHEQLARWLETNAPQLAELDELAGWHFEQAVHYRHDLRQPPDPDLRHRAAEHLYAAGRRAAGRGDAAAAVNLYTRAHDNVPSGHPLHARIAVDLAETLIYVGDLPRSDELLRLAEADPDLRLLAGPVRLQWLSLSDPHLFAKRVRAQLPELLPELAEAGDSLGLAKAHLMAAYGHNQGCQWAPTAREALLAAEFARSAGDDGILSTAHVTAIPALVWGPMHIEESAKRVADLLASTSNRYVEAAALHARAERARCRGDLQEARAALNRWIMELTDLGWAPMATVPMMELADVELDAGDPNAAREILLRADSLVHGGQRAWRSTVQANLARVEQELGNRRAAEAALELCDELGAPEDVVNFALTDPVRARFALADGDHTAAERWARRGAEYAFRTDWSVLRGAAKLALAEILRACGKRDEATGESRAALAEYTRKGDQTGAARATAMLAELGARESSTEAADAAPPTTRAG